MRYSHLAIQLSHIMLNSDGCPVIIDLGSCVALSNEMPVSDQGLTLTYAKLCRKHATSTEHYDLLCLSVVLYSLSTGQHMTGPLDYTLEFSVYSLCSRFVILCKELKDVDRGHRYH